jgi:hypothetical protein
VVGAEQAPDEPQGQAGAARVVVEVSEQTLPGGVGLAGDGDGEHLGVGNGEAGVGHEGGEGRRFVE